MVRRRAVLVTPVVAALPAACGVVGQTPSATLRIMPLGDSITRGEHSSTGDGYRWALADRLTGTAKLTRAEWVGSQRDGRQPNPAHEGHSGYTIDQIAAGLDGWLRAAAPVDYVLLHAGTNDALSATLGPTITARLSRLVDRILGYGVKGVAVAKLTPMLSNGPASVWQQVANAQIPAMAAAKGARVAVADMSILGSGHLADGEHPNDAGYDLMSWCWYQAVAKLPGISTTGFLPATPCPLPSVPSLG